MVVFAFPKNGLATQIQAEEYFAMATTCEELAKMTPDPYSKHVLERSVEVLLARSKQAVAKQPEASDQLRNSSSTKDFGTPSVAAMSGSSANDTEPKPFVAQALVL